ncbi:MAG TPA: hypothetical protein VNO81_06165 [Candidatus Nitrosotenuis sp.]|nr:hypothetical protein [Candidatus Nitrosotenuis sp.]
MNVRTLAALVLVLVALGSLPRPVLAEPQGPGPEKAAGILQDLDLTEEQARQVQALLSAEREKIAAIRKDTQTRLQAILTPEQYARLAERLARRGQGQGGPAHRLRRLTQELGLTPEQQEKVQAILAEMRPKMQKASPEERQALRQELQSRLAAVLTPEQMQKFQELKAKHGKRRGQGIPPGPSQEPGPQEP